MFQKNLKQIKKMAFRFGVFFLRNIRELFSFGVWDGIRKRGSLFLGIKKKMYFSQ